MIASRAIGKFLIRINFVLGSCCQFMMLEMIYWKLLFEHYVVLPSDALSCQLGNIFHKTVTPFLAFWSRASWETYKMPLKDKFKFPDLLHIRTNRCTSFYGTCISLKPAAVKPSLSQQPVTIHPSFLLSLSLSLANNLITSLLANAIAFSLQVLIRLFSPRI